MKNILWLTEGFPIESEPYNGDGIERRGKAVSLYNKVFLIYVKKNKGIGFGKVRFQERIYNNNFRAFIYEYPSIGRFSRFLDTILSNYYIVSLHLKAVSKLVKTYGKPDGIQVNVTMKNGVIALFYKWKWKISYIVVEGWSWFLPEERQFLKRRGLLFNYFTRKVLKHASMVITLSEHLGKTMHQHIYPIRYRVIPNVVDNTIFHPATATDNTSAFRFIHISNLTPTKNIEQILLAFASIIHNGYNAELLIHAPASVFLTEKITALGLSDVVILREEARQEILANSIRTSNALILFSLFETFGNVIIEANACGVPVITSDYPTFFEMVEEGVNGIIAKGKDAPALADAMIRCIAEFDRFDCQKISKQTTNLYSFQRIGKMFDDIYNEYF